MIHHKESIESPDHWSIETRNFPFLRRGLMMSVGRSSDSQAIPSFPPGSNSRAVVYQGPVVVRTTTSVYSSGDCCRITRHSLLISLHGETIARQRYTFIGRKQAIRRNISAKRAPPLCAADRSDHDASLFRQTAARLWHALCTYFSQLRHSNRSEVSSFI